MGYALDDHFAHSRQQHRAEDRPAARRNRRRALAWRCACLWLLCACATSLGAQTSQPPAPGGTGDASPSSTRRTPALPPQTMTLAVSLFGGNSDEMTDSSTSAIAIAGPYADADAMLTYERRVGRATFGLNGRSVLRGAQSTLTPKRQQGGFDFAVVGLRQQFHATQTLSYSPYYQFGGMGDSSLTPLAESAQSHGDFANADLTAITSNTEAEWSHSLSRRVALSTSYGLRRTTFDGSDLNMSTQFVGARLTRRITRFASLRTGYTYRIAHAAITTSRQPSEHDLDVGVDYNRPLSFARRTTFSFASGSTMIPQDKGMAFRLTGDAALAKAIGRTWSARVGVNRSVQLLEGFAEPVLANTLSLAVGGALQRRVSFSTTASLSTGEVGLTAGSGNGYANWRTGAGLGITVSRRGALDVQYFFAGDQFDEGVVVPAGLSNGRRQRQGMRVGFTWRMESRPH